MATTEEKIDLVCQFVTSIQSAVVKAQDPEVLLLNNVKTFRCHYDGAVVAWVRSTLGLWAHKAPQQPEDCATKREVTAYDVAGRKVGVKASDFHLQKVSRFTMSQRVVQYYKLGDVNMDCDKTSDCRCCDCRDNRLTLHLSQTLKRRRPQYQTWVRHEVGGYGLRSRKPLMLTVSGVIVQEILHAMLDDYLHVGWKDSLFESSWERLCGVVNSDYTLDPAEKMHTRLMVHDICQHYLNRQSDCTSLEN